jgi:argininosuccinate lyase
MPQKKNPDGFELIRAKAAMTTGLLTGFLGVMKGLPTGYNKDLQEDKEAFLKAFENVRLCLSVLRLSVRTVKLRTDRLERAAADSFMGATDLADFLVMKGVPFRNAHEIVARAVREALDQNKQLNEIDLSAFSPHFSELPADYLTPENIVARKNHSSVLPNV